MIVEKYDACVIGAGPAGLFIAGKLIANGFKVAIIETSDIAGGQLNLYKEKYIYNIPMVREITARGVCEYLKVDCDNNKIKCNFLFNTNINRIKKNQNVAGEEQYEIFIDKAEKQEIISSNLECKYLIFALGKGMHLTNKIPIISANEYEGKSLFYSIDDKDLFKDKNIVIAGGGDSAIDWAVELSEIAKSIVVVHRREINKVDNQQFQKFCDLCEKKKITKKVPYSISNLQGANGFLNAVETSNIDNNVKETIVCDYLLPFYGIKSIKSDITTKCNGFVINENIDGILVSDKTCEVLGCKNVFAIGDCCYYDNKIKNIPVSFFEGMKCFYTICKNSSKKMTGYYDRH